MTRLRPRRSPIPTAVRSIPDSDGNELHGVAEAMPRSRPASMTTAPIAVVMSRFPKFTETFVANEIVGLERLGATIEIFPLLSEQSGRRHPAFEPLVERARFGSPWGVRAFSGLGSVLVRRPVTLLGIVGRLVRDTWHSPGMLVKDLVLLPRICEISREISSLGVRHVHAHFLTHGGFAAWCLGRLTGLPYSVVAHGSDVHRHRAMMRTKVVESSFVAAVSDFNRGVIIEECGPDVADRVVTVRCGIDLDRVIVNERALRGSTTRLLCVGTMHEVKGQRFLIEAAALLASRGHPVDVELIGDGPDRYGLESLSEDLGLGERIHFAGALAHDDVLARYAHADVVVVPSIASSDGRREGIPTVLMEAMASEVPVVASRLAGIPELVEDGVTGVLADPGSPSSLADAVCFLLASPERAAAIAAAGRRSVVKEYALEQTAHRMLHLIDLVGSHGDTSTRSTVR